MNDTAKTRKNRINHLESENRTLKGQNRMNMEDIKVFVWRYFMSYWNNRRICSFNDGLPPNLKSKRYYEALNKIA